MVEEVASDEVVGSVAEEEVVEAEVVVSEDVVVEVDEEEVAEEVEAEGDRIEKSCISHTSNRNLFANAVSYLPRVRILKKHAY